MSAFLYWKLWGATSDQCYTYTGVGGKCRRDCPQVADKVSGHSAGRGETALLNSVAQRVTSVAIAATDIMSYAGGIFDGTCGGRVNHAVNVVGYGTEGSKDFWKLRNSWSTTWGEQGYFRFIRGSGSGAGQC